MVVVLQTCMVMLWKIYWAAARDVDDHDDKMPDRAYAACWPAQISDWMAHANAWSTILTPVMMICAMCFACIRATQYTLSLKKF